MTDTMQQKGPCGRQLRAGASAGYVEGSPRWREGVRLEPAGSPNDVRRGGGDRGPHRPGQRVSREPDVGKPTYLDYDPDNLVAACVAGDQQAWHTIVERLSPLVWTIARSHRLSAADCQDVYQLTWTLAVQHLHQLRSPDRLAAWITTTARRECLKQIQRSRQHVPVGDSALLDAPEPHADLPGDAVVRRERNDEVLAAFRKLPARDQALLGVLMADPAPSYEEASRILGLPIGTIGPRRQRALARLRGILAA